MLSVDKPGNSALALHLRDHMQSHRCLTGGFRSVDLNDSAARNSADPERHIQAEGTCGNRFHIEDLRLLAKLHDRPFTELLFNLTKRCFQCFLFIFVCHNNSLSSSDSEHMFALCIYYKSYIHTCQLFLYCCHT